MTPTDRQLDHAAALAGLPEMTPVRLAAVLATLDPVEAWTALARGTHPADPKRRFAAAARAGDPRGVGESYRGAGIQVLVPGDGRYPPDLVGDPGAPAVLFAHGDPSVLVDRHRVAIVGTRSATPYGRQVAAELGRDLAAAGVAVISGLARGIDGAAHAGALSVADGEGAPPVAVVGTGLDAVYPSSNAPLWEQVVARGVVFSESPLRTPPRPKVFPARNRIIAALSDVVVVVESHHGGGSLYTVDAAARRGIPVAAVPGSVRSRASDGTNGLLVDGCIPVRDATDVLVAVSLARSGRPAPAPAPLAATLVAARGRRSAVPSRSTGSNGSSAPQSEAAPSPAITEAGRSVLEAIDDTPTTFETILLRTGLSIAPVAEACEDLVAHGLVLAGAGWWSRR
ncbi:MAG TPA: DNA-protecting protein DprA [Acidimicrobiales bacterium]|jgi:DNA processing protein|nr:DNA-protecting protein DprA [Acidimicrobiales bacterium]